ncbi:helicase-like protein, partial [Trifolium medium]|nr:helicase-like protein [Trifolium medium]
MLGECRGLLNNFVLQPNSSDLWLWRHDIGGSYTVRDAYALLTTMDDVDTDAISDLIWHKQVPLKVSVLAWRLIRNRFALGLVFPQLIRSYYRITLFSLSIVLTDCELAAHFCSLFGCVAFRLYDMSGIAESLRQPSLPYTK